MSGDPKFYSFSLREKVRLRGHGKSGQQGRRGVLGIWLLLSSVAMLKTVGSWHSPSP
jgi:hypothetical protein